MTQVKTVGPTTLFIDVLIWVGVIIRPLIGTHTALITVVLDCAAALVTYAMVETFVADIVACMRRLIHTLRISMLVPTQVVHIAPAALNRLANTFNE